MKPGELRLGAYAAIRSFARSQLERSGLAPQVLERYANWCLSCAEELAEEAQGGAMSERSDALARWRVDLLATVERAMHGGPMTASSAETALRILLALGDTLLQRGPLERFDELLGPGSRCHAWLGGRSLGSWPEPWRSEGASRRGPASWGGRGGTCWRHWI